MASVPVGGVDLTMAIPNNIPAFTGSITTTMLGTANSAWVNTNTGQTHMYNGGSNGIVNGSYGIAAGISGNAPKSRANLTVAGKGFCILIDGEDGEEIVRLRNDGKVVWKNGVQLDEGVKAFSSLLRLGVAESAGVGASVREEIRNQVYADLIAMAKEKGSLTEEDLTFDRDSCILVEKLAKPTL
jgi:hypothetical protein